MGKSLDLVHHVAGSVVGTLRKHPPLEQSHPNQRAGWKEMEGGISRRYLWRVM